MCPTVVSVFVVSVPALIFVSYSRQCFCCLCTSFGVCLLQSSVFLLSLYQLWYISLTVVSVFVVSVPALIFVSYSRQCFCCLCTSFGICLLQSSVFLLSLYQFWYLSLTVVSVFVVFVPVLVYVSYSRQCFCCLCTSFGIYLLQSSVFLLSLYQFWYLSLTVVSVFVVFVPVLVFVSYSRQCFCCLCTSFGICLLQSSVFLLSLYQLWYLSLTVVSVFVVSVPVLVYVSYSRQCFCCLCTSFGMSITVANVFVVAPSFLGRGRSEDFIVTAVTARKLSQLDCLWFLQGSTDHKAE